MAMTDEEWKAGRKRLAYLLLKQNVRTKAEENGFVGLKSCISAEDNHRKFIVARGTPTEYDSPMPAIVRESKARAEKDRKGQSKAHSDPEEVQ